MRRDAQDNEIATANADWTTWIVTPQVAGSNPAPAAVMAG
jgi:hypothetical protein